MIRFALRETLAVPIALAVLGFELFNYLDRGRPWRGDLVWSLDWAGAVFILMSGVVTAGAAFAGARSGDEARVTVAGVADHPLRGLLFQILALFIPAALVHVVFVGLYVGAVPDRADGFASQIGMATSHQLLVLVFYLVLGFGVGRSAGIIFGPILSVGVALTVGGGLLIAGGTVNPLNTGRATSPLVEFGLSRTWVAESTLVLVILTGAVVFALRAARPPDRRPVVGTTLGVIALLAVAPAILPGGPRLTPASARSGFACEQTTVVVCVRRPHERLLDSTTRAVQNAMAKADQNGIRKAFPMVFHEVLPSQGVGSRGEGRFSIPLKAYSSDAVSPTELASSLALPMWCSSLYGSEPPGMDFFDDVDLVARGLTQRMSSSVRAPLAAAVQRLAQCR